MAIKKNLLTLPEFMSYKPEGEGQFWDEGGDAGGKNPRLFSEVMF